MLWQLSKNIFGCFSLASDLGTAVEMAQKWYYPIIDAFIHLDGSGKQSIFWNFVVVGEIALIFGEIVD